MMTQIEPSVSESSKWEWEIKLFAENEQHNRNLSLQKCGNQKTLNNIEGADYIIIPDSDVCIRFDYPLNHPMVKRFHHAGGFSRKTLVKCIYQVYRELSS